MKTEAGSQNDPPIVIGIVALQGGFDLHKKSLESVSVKTGIEIFVKLIKKPEHLQGVDGLIFPGGESTVVTKLLISSGLDDPIRKLIDGGMNVFGTCAGLIVLVNHFSAIDCEVKRNSYGTQINSFETQIDFVPLSIKCDVSFIRAPSIVSIGGSVEIIARNKQETVGVMEANVIGIACHPEVAGNDIFHEFFVQQIQKRLKSLT